ncbi:MAG: thiamine pyrophosphate-dependent enzyme [Candidatus Cloacimonetes bacterium]|jgi:2-oxoglutarate ferredoxin oxidoreductase subunit beta|nr:thiamine pyrophosphate-dependent enzyme [Candidatus Cloacimonadota bacterium]MDD3283330.1 thiamine pyrophosphate-dependent enzyme [Candidatus Cloacimonadota bacterium]MDY0299067.1 thiamine pyrophosphate-dependent enzyme [Candidatus Cloacimonadaceae bacterium]
MRSLKSSKENTWCIGCGNFGIFAAFRKCIQSLVDEGYSLADIVITSGIGCHGKIFDYLDISGVYGLHGRALATAQGIKIANPKLHVISFGGDGDSMGEGLEHTLFAAKRNMDITLILHNNGNYGLTTGQASPLSNIGFKGISTPNGNVERPFNAVNLLIEAGASFVARAYSANIDHLSHILHKAIIHRGFSFVEVLQPCVSYNNTYELFNNNCMILDTLPTDKAHARSLASDPDVFYLGVFHEQQLPVYHESIAIQSTSMTLAQRIQYIHNNK